MSEPHLRELKAQITKLRTVKQRASPTTALYIYGCKVAIFSVEKDCGICYC